jgi:hypothetical protein
VPIDVGAKLTGTVGRTDVGVLDVRTGDLREVTPKNMFVGRVKRNFLRQSYVGAIVASGNPAASSVSNTFGADARLATLVFWAGLGSRPQAWPQERERRCFRSRRIMGCL